MKIDHLELTHSDREKLLSPVGWLNDRIVLAAQMLLKKQSPWCGGLQDTILGQTLSFQVETTEFIQILHSGFGHWLTISTLGVDGDKDVMVYDSLYPSVGTYIQKQIAALLHTREPEIKVHMMDMQI